MKVQSTERDSASNDIIDNKRCTVEYRAKMCDKFEIQISNIAFYLHKRDNIVSSVYIDRRSNCAFVDRNQVNERYFFN